ncbi:MAG: hypothetical protein C7K11_09370 [Candidatus Amulumruptor caecigallinarius]|nr:MAG: hypothetical protein C7K11_09370 [Candidatus Amulumruptor caecigallinarius]
MKKTDKCLTDNRPLNSEKYSKAAHTALEYSPGFAANINLSKIHDGLQVAHPTKCNDIATMTY